MGASPLERQEQADGALDEEGGSGGVQLGQLLLLRQLRGVAVRDLEQEEDEDHGDAAKRQADVEAPPPSHLASEGAAQQRADDGRQPKDGAEDALVQGTLMQRDGIYNNDNLNGGEGGDMLANAG